MRSAHTDHDIAAKQPQHGVALRVQSIYADSPDNRGISGPTKRTCVLQKFKKKQKTHVIFASLLVA